MTHSKEITSSQEILSETPTAGNINITPNPPRKNLRTSKLSHSKEAMKNDLSNPSYIGKPRNNLNKTEKLALKEIKSWDDKVIQVQDKGSTFVVLLNNDHESKVQHQIHRSLFPELDIYNI